MDEQEQVPQEEPQHTMFEQYTSVTGVHIALGDRVRRGTCAGCGRENIAVYPWPLDGVFGCNCAVCVVKESGGLAAA